MGYYLCPRCGSKDSFIGNELVSGSESLGSVGMVNSEGGYVQRNQGSRLRHKQVEVVKCRDCGEILGDQNWRYTPEEIAQQEKARAARQARQKELDAQSWKETKNAFLVSFQLCASNSFCLACLAARAFSCWAISSGV